MLAALAALAALPSPFGRVPADVRGANDRSTGHDLAADAPDPGFAD
jgi:hypothetical protein